MLKRVASCIAQLHKDEAGQGLVEYALIMGLVVFAAVGTIGTLATEVNSAFSIITAKLQNALAT
jgi:Flp pilus assembly pilin Flp